MRYDRDRKIVRGILKTADIANTLNGGMSQTAFRSTRMEDHYLVNLKVPGVETASLTVDIINNHVIISHLLKFDYETSELDVPHVVANIPITLDVDYKKISAMEENGILKVILPFNELAGGYRRRVEINR